MHILVTGATGGLGRNAVEFLLKSGVRVTATGRNVQVGAALNKHGAHFVACDLSNADASTLASLVNNVDVVWHCAALSSPWGNREAFEASNIIATERLLTVAGNAGVQKFVHISTPAIYFDFKHHYNVAEDFCAAKPANEYARTKIIAETKVAQAAEKFTNMHCVILRPRAIFGPHDQVLIPRLQAIMARKNGRLPLPRGGKTMIDMTYVENVVHAMWLATNLVNIPSASIFNISNDQPELIANVLQKLFVGALKEKMHIVNVPYKIVAVAAASMEFISNFTKSEPSLTRYSAGVMAFDMTLNINHAKNLLGYQPIISMDEGILRTAKWLLENKNG
jgi:nucleoside-diphosphate-sugar epimerase